MYNNPYYEYPRYQRYPYTNNRGYHPTPKRKRRVYDEDKKRILYVWGEACGDLFSKEDCERYVSKRIYEKRIGSSRTNLTGGHAGVGIMVLFCSRDPSRPICVVHPNQSQWTTIASGIRATRAISGYGEICTWDDFGILNPFQREGMNVPQIDPNTMEESFKQVSCGLNHVAAISKDDDSLYVW